MPYWSEPIPFEINDPVVQAGEVTAGFATRRRSIPKRRVRITMLSAKNNTSHPCLIQIGYQNTIGGTERFFPLNSGYVLSAENSITWTGALEVTCENISGIFISGIVAGDEIYFKGTYQMLVD